MNSALGPAGADAGFLAYVAFLALSGVLMMVLAISGFGASSMGWRIFNGLAGLAFAGYAFYLFFIFEGGTYRIFIYAFALPVILLIQAIRQRTSRNQATPQPPAPPPPAA